MEADYYCPRTHQPLAATSDDNSLISPAGDRYQIVDRIPILLLDAGRQEAVSHKQDYYRKYAAEYDRGNDVMYRMLLCDEATTRAGIISMLQVKDASRILEIGCGTCRDTSHLLRTGSFVYASDLSLEMARIGRQRLLDSAEDTTRLRLFVADAMRLPFPDGHFDAVFHFGGLNVFPDVAKALAEMARVTKVGGRVVAGDEGVGPWLAGTNFSNVLENSNPLFRHRAPLDKVPILARNVTCQWILNGSFYVIAFDVGKGEPQLDLDIQFPGWRGGSHRSRYFGKLEGVSPQLRDDVVKSAAREGISVVAWLEKALREALDDKSSS